MIRLALRRIGWSIVVVWFVVTATFAMIAAIPADPVKALLGPHSTPEAIVRVRAYYCLDRGVVGQYGCYFKNVVRGDLGESYRSKRAVTSILASRVWPTVQLTLAAILLQLVIGVPLGVIAAVRRNRWPDHAATVFGLIGQSAPTFFVGTLLLYLFAYRFGWFPIGGYGEGGLDRLYHLVLPAATLATVGVAYYARVVRSEMIETLSEDYVRTARAKGVSERRVIVRHALRNALGPLVTIVGLDLGILLGGALVTEYIFAWPGLGREVLQAILEVDIPLILGVVLVSAIAIAVANLIVDLMYLWIDPRLRD
ncbi:MAG: Peptide transporter, permease protein [Myxococcales bacterium]|nr:Peptide transporter, permease protein [Myxococcales bacterium]